jgi:3D (Asp-Asp-Asp) domain-containing protein
MIANDPQNLISAKLNISKLYCQKKTIHNQGDPVILDLKISFTNFKIKIIRPFPVTIKLLGKKIVYYTFSQPLCLVLRQAKIPFAKNDRVVPSLDSVVKPNQQIVITRITNKTVVQAVILKPGTEYLNTHNATVDYQYIPGRSGEAWRWFNIIYENGIELKRVLLKEKIIKAPLNNVVFVKDRFDSRLIDEPLRQYTFQSLRIMESTAYYPGPECTGKYAVYGLTYTGKKARYGLVAVDPRVIRLGTMLYIEGYGYAEAADIGGAIKGNKIDLCFNTYREAKDYGRKKIKVCIFKNAFTRQ